MQMRLRLKLRRAKRSNRGVCRYIHTYIDDDMYTTETPPHIRTARASPQRHTAAGTAAPTTADTENTVPQRGNPTQTAYARPRKRGFTFNPEAG